MDLKNRAGAADGLAGQMKRAALWIGLLIVAGSLLLAFGPAGPEVCETLSPTSCSRDVPTASSIVIGSLFTAAIVCWPIYGLGAVLANQAAIMRHLSSAPPPSSPPHTTPPSGPRASTGSRTQVPEEWERRISEARVPAENARALILEGLKGGPRNALDLESSTALHFSQVMEVLKALESEGAIDRIPGHPPRFVLWR